MPHSASPTRARASLVAEGCVLARMGELLCLLGNPSEALAFTSTEVVSACMCHGSHIAVARVRGVALAAQGEMARAAACLEEARAGAAEQG